VVGVGDLESEDHRRAADRRRSQHAHLGELVGQVQVAVTDPQLHRHQPDVRDRNATDLLHAEGVAVEPGGPVGALHDESLVWLLPYQEVQTLRGMIVALTKGKHRVRKPS